MKFERSPEQRRRDVRDIERELADPPAKSNGRQPRALAMPKHPQSVRVTTGTPDGIPDEELEDATDVIREGQAIAEAGIPYLLDGIIPGYGMLGFLVAFSKVGKTTFGLQLAAAVAAGREFLDRPTTQARSLVLAAEDPKPYTAWLARDLDVPSGQMTFRRKPLVLTADSLRHVCATIRNRHYGFVLIASWQAVVRGLIDNENDNAGSVLLVERIKVAARETGIPWLIDAHSGKGEDQSDDADPSRAMRGASAAAAAADYTLSLRYANGTFGTQRKLSGKGRFVNLDPLLLDFDPATSTYQSRGPAKAATRESTWRLICERGPYPSAHAARRRSPGSSA